MFAAARLSLAALALCTLAACGDTRTAEDAEDKADDEAAAEALGRDTDETVLDDMIQTQDRARGVEDLTLGRKDELDQAMEASAGDAAADEE
jgi:hypothetical protein